VSSRAQDPLCPWNETICAQAAKTDHLHVLQWTRAHNPPCPWDEQTCGCIYNMLLRVVTCMYVLQWACAPWDGQTCAYIYATESGYLHVCVAVGLCFGPSLPLLEWADS
jgi:hypothetical protein